MSYRIISIALLTALLSSSAIAQGGGSAGGASSGGAAGGAPGSAPSGTAGVSPSTSNPGVGTPGIPGPSSGAGLPGGPGPGSTAVVPNQPPPPAPGPTVGRASGSNIGSPVPPTSTAGGLGPQSSPGAQSRVPATGNTQPDNNFHPEAVIDGALDNATNDIAAMTTSELRSLVQVFEACTAKEHPVERAGKCGTVSRLHRTKYLKERQIDRSMTELERVVRFQNMFRTSRIPSTEYEDRINNRLRTSARLALATNELRARQARDNGAPPDLTKDVRMAK